MYGILLTLHVIVCFVLILVVLIQSGRSGGLSGLMGGGGGDALFSTSGQQSGLRNLTFILAGLFMATSVGLTMLASRAGTNTVLRKNFTPLPPVGAQSSEQAPSSANPGEMPEMESNSIPATENTGNSNSTK